MVQDQLSFFAALYRVDEYPDLGMWLLYGTIAILSIASYKLGFSQRLPILKSAIIYAFLLLGSTILCFLAIFLPITEGLFVIVLVLVIYRIRRYREKKKEIQA